MLITAKPATIPSPAPAASALSDSQALKALDYLEKQPLTGSHDSGIYRHVLGLSVRVHAEDALSRLDGARPLYVQGPQGQLELHGRTELAALDQLMGSHQANLMPDDQAAALQSLDLRSGQDKLDPYTAWHQLSTGQTLTVNAGPQPHQARSLTEASELSALYGKGTHTDVTPGQLQALKYFDGKITCQDGFEALRDLRQDFGGVVIRCGDNVEEARTLAQLEELNALEGQKTNTILPQAQFDALQSLSAGLGKSPFQALQSLKAGQALEYSFAGGDFGEKLSVPVAKLDNLPQARALVDNTRARDQYRLPFEEFSHKLGDLGQQIPSLSESALTRAQKAEKEAQAMPTKVEQSYTDMEYHMTHQYGFNPRTHHYDTAWGYKRAPVELSRTVHNDGRDAQLKESAAEQKAVQTAQQAYTKLAGDLAGLAPGQLGSLKADLADWSKAAKATDAPALGQVADRMAALIQHNESRPERPAGWKAAEPNLSGDTPVKDRPAPTPEPFYLPIWP